MKIRKLKSTCGPHKLWSPDEEALLGTDTDSAVAKLVNRTEKAVREKREKLDIPPKFPRPRWGKKELAALNSGIAPKVASKIQRSLRAVYNKRQRLRIQEAV